MKKIMDILTRAGSKQSIQQEWGYLPFILSILANCLWPIGWLYCNQNKISFAQSTIARGIVTLFFSYTACLYSNNPSILIYKSNLKLLSIRSILMTFHSLTTGLAQFILPLPIVHTIACSGTLFVFIIDYFINGTKINIKQFIGIILGIIGVVLASNGKIITKYFDNTYQYHTIYQNYLIDDNYIISLFTIGYCCIVIGWAYGIVLTRMANANTFQINFILGIIFYFCGLIILPYMGYLGYKQLDMIQNIKIIIYTGIPCYIVQILVIASLNMTKQTGVISMTSFSMVAVSYGISIFRYKETPNFIASLGIVLVVVGVWKTIFNKSV